MTVYVLIRFDLVRGESASQKLNIVKCANCGPVVGRKLSVMSKHEMLIAHG